MRIQLPNKLLIKNKNNPTVAVYNDWFVQINGSAIAGLDYIQDSNGRKYIDITERSFIGVYYLVDGSASPGTQLKEFADDIRAEGDGYLRNIPIYGYLPVSFLDEIVPSGLPQADGTLTWRDWDNNNGLKAVNLAGDKVAFGFMPGGELPSDEIAYTIIDYLSANGYEHLLSPQMQAVLSDPNEYEQNLI